VTLRYIDRHMTHGKLLAQYRSTAMHTVGGPAPGTASLLLAL